MNVFISYSHRDSQYAWQIKDLLEDNGITVLGDFDFRENRMPHSKSQDAFSILDNQLRSADAVIFIITPNFTDSYAASRELSAAAVYHETYRQPALIPLLFDDVASDKIPVDITGMLYLRTNRYRFKETLGKVLAHLFLLIKEKESIKKEKAEREQYLSDYINEATAMLKANRRQYKVTAYVCYLSTISLVVFSIIRSMQAAVDFTSLSQWPLVVSELSRSILTLILILSLARLLFTLGKSFMVESIRNSDRLHAIEFGKFYLKAYGNIASREEVRAVFESWNIDSGSSFITQSANDYDPHLIESLFNAINALKKSS